MMGSNEVAVLHSTDQKTGQDQRVLDTLLRHVEASESEAEYERTSRDNLNLKDWRSVS